MRYLKNYYSDGRGALVLGVRAGSRIVERPVREVVLEAVFAPVIVYAFWRALRGGWGH